MLLLWYVPAQIHCNGNWLLQASNEDQPENDTLASKLLSHSTTTHWREIPQQLCWKQARWEVIGGRLPIGARPRLACWPAKMLEVGAPERLRQTHDEASSSGDDFNYRFNIP